MAKTRKLSMTEAIRQARPHVGEPSGSGIDWSVWAPYRRNDVHSPTTQITSNSYYESLRDRRRTQAAIALCMMGWDEIDALGAADDAAQFDLTDSMADIVRRANRDLTNYRDRHGEAW